MMSAGVFIGCLLAAPFVALADWLTWIQRQPPGQQELAKVCHGAGMVTLIIWSLEVTNGFFPSLTYLVLDPHNPLYWIPVVIFVWGLGWVLLNVRTALLTAKSAQRATMMVRALLKLGVGYAIWSFARDIDASVPAVMVGMVGVWCLATGGTKFALMFLGGSGKARGLVDRDIRSKEFHWDDEDVR